MKSNEWLAERTFHHSNFWDIKQLVEMKERQGLSISLCLPTLNEERTIGQEIVILKAEMAKTRAGGKSEVLEVLIGYRWKEMFGGFDRDPSTIEWPST